MTVPSIKFACPKCGKAEIHISADPKYCYCIAAAKARAKGKMTVKRTLLEPLRGTRMTRVDP